MEEEVLRNAAYRGTMRAFAVLCFLASAVWLVVALFLFLAGDLLAPVSPILLFVFGLVLQSISRRPRAPDGPQRAPAAKGWVDPAGNPALAPDRAPGIDGVTPSQPEVRWD